MYRIVSSRVALFLPGISNYTPPTSCSRRQTILGKVHSDRKMIVPAVHCPAAPVDPYQRPPPQFCGRLSISTRKVKTDWRLIICRPRVSLAVDNSQRRIGGEGKGAMTPNEFQERPSGASKMQENLLATVLRPRPRWGSLYSVPTNQ